MEYRFSSQPLTHLQRALRLPHPNEGIEYRIILEAKRLLVNTSLSAKQITCALGYNAPAYFSRLLWFKQADCLPGSAQAFWVRLFPSQLLII